MNRITVYLKDGSIDVYDDGEMGYDGCGSQWVTLPDGSRVTYPKINILKYKVQDGSARMRKAQEVLAEIIMTSV